MDYKNLLNFEKKRVLVSGGSRGIGEAIARAFAANGAHVLICSRKLDACEVVAASIREQGQQATATACHQGSMEDIGILFDQIEHDFGGLDVLINCGATSPYFGPVAQTPESAFDKTVDVNLKGPFYMSARAVQLMQKQKAGVVINIASINGLSPGRDRGIYSMTKAAMINMTGAFAREYGADGIRVNAIAPGLIETRLSSALTADEQALQGYIKRFAIPRIGQPSDIVGAALYFASDAAAFTTGVTLTVDGGLTI